MLRCHSFLGTCSHNAFSTNVYILSLSFLGTPVSMRFAEEAYSKLTTEAKICLTAEFNREVISVLIHLEHPIYILLSTPFTFPKYSIPLSKNFVLFRKHSILARQHSVLLNECSAVLFPTYSMLLPWCFILEHKKGRVLSFF